MTRDEPLPMASPTIPSSHSLILGHIRGIITEFAAFEIMKYTLAVFVEPVHKKERKSSKLYH